MENIIILNIYVEVNVEFLNYHDVERDDGQKLHDSMWFQGILHCIS